jgi:hypothetical protein
LANASRAFELRVIADEQGRLVLHAGGRAFTFGPIQTRWNDPVTPSYQSAPEAGDVVSFTRTLGRLPWLTPFTFSWLGGASPKMKRLIYDRLTWTKASGARLKVLWRGEEWFYPGSGWADTWSTRLTRVQIDGSASQD